MEDGRREGKKDSMHFSLSFMKEGDTEIQFSSKFILVHTDANLSVQRLSTTLKIRDLPYNVVFIPRRKITTQIAGSSGKSSVFLTNRDSFMQMCAEACNVIGKPAFHKGPISSSDAYWLCYVVPLLTHIQRSYIDSNMSPLSHSLTS